jgi:pectin methylesterase-like acyl-CoA thioesterase
VVSDVDEFQAAFAAVKSTNNNVSASRKTIFIKNGDYDFGSDEQRLDAYNVSLIGESRDGVVLHGNRDGISNPVLNLRDRSGFYLQDLTVRNDKNYGKDDKVGVGVAIYGGDKTVMKNVRMLSNQDTQVTGHRAYFENCQIHGTVDFICGGGDNYYYHTDLVLEDRGGNVIAAPSTSASLKWGYVFQQCTISAADGATAVTDGSYNLGRPWQDTPRAYYLNTRMNVKPSDNGWAGMGTLPTYFYEYGSTDKDGNEIDLTTVRGNSPTSTNSYTPVLTTDEADKFTIENVLGGTDSWLPTEECVTVAAPTAMLDGSSLSWTSVDDARCYVVFKNGHYLTNTTATTINDIDEGVYTVRAANLNGGLGEESNTVLKRNITAGKWGTIVLPFAMTESQLKSTFGNDVKVAELTAGDATTLTFSSVAATNANQPYAIKVASDFAGAAISGVTIENGTPEQTVGDWTFVGSYADVADIPVGAYFFSANKLVKAGTGNTMKSTRAYLVNGNASAPALNIIFDGETTGITTTDFSDYTDKAGATFDLQGRKIKNAAQKGVYIVNGKKVIK